jgi:hypothetical protein
MSIILAVVLYGCNLVSRIEGRRRSRKFENRVIIRIFGPKRKKVTGDWRQFRNYFHNLYSSRNIIMVIKSRRIR